MKVSTLLHLILVLILSSCSSELRESFCEDATESLGERYWGIYEVVMPAKSTSWSGNIILKATRIKLERNAILASTEGFPMVPDWARACEVDGRFFFEMRNPNGTYSITEASRFNQGMVLSTMSFDLDAVKTRGFSYQYLPESSSLVEQEEGGVITFDGITTGKFILDNRSLTPEQVLSVAKPVSFQVVLRSVPDEEPFVVQSRIPLGAPEDN